jgi:predicted metal-binding membrane protein
MNEMPMGGDAAQMWFVAPAAFVGMWVAMMVPMMLPSLISMLWRYRPVAAATRSVRPGLATALAGAGYFFVWTVCGAAAFPLSVVVTRLPHIATGVIVIVTGAWQLTSWKAHHLECCRQAMPASTTLGGAWRHGTSLGIACARSCGNLMILPLVFGMMDLGVMALVGIAITLERLAPAGDRAARALGVATMAVGAILIVSASVS